MKLNERKKLYSILALFLNKFVLKTTVSEDTHDHTNGIYFYAYSTISLSIKSYWKTLSPHSFLLSRFYTFYVSVLYIVLYGMDRYV